MAKIATTMAMRELASLGIDHKLHQYEYIDKGGTAQSAKELGIDEHSVIKTIVLADEFKKCYIALMHGDKEISTKELARIIGVKKIEPADANLAMKQTGYQFGGTSPFGTKVKIPIYANESIFDLDRIYINAGKRGLLAEIIPSELQKLDRMHLASFEA